MNTYTPRNDQGQFESWNSRTDDAKNEGRMEGAVAMIVLSVVITGIGYGLQKISKKFFD